MPPSPVYTEQPWTKAYNEIIDVRSPSEFAEDHIPGAINLPVLNDAQRVEVGTLYKQVCPFTARKVGAALVAQNISHHLTGHLASKDKAYRPLVYCWRGGQRSSSMASVLTQIGWPVMILQGGYKTYRAYVREQLQHLPRQFTYQVVCGLTGTGKTQILQQLGLRGTQVLDLEDLANHRGSLLGEQWQTPQPSQKRFESLLLHYLRDLDPTKPVWVEAESNKIGRIYLPQSLWKKLTQASCVEVQVPLTARIKWILQGYPHLTAHPDLLKSKLEKLKSRYSREKLHEWYHLVDTQQWEDLVTNLLRDHYDPTYTHALNHVYANVERVMTPPDLSNASIERLVSALIPDNALPQQHKALSLTSTEDHCRYFQPIL